MDILRTDLSVCSFPKGEWEESSLSIFIEEEDQRNGESAPSQLDEDRT